MYVKLALSSLWFPPMKNNKETGGKKLAWLFLAFCLIFIKLTTRFHMAPELLFKSI